jgi:hypothetical protein
VFVFDLGELDHSGGFMCRVVCQRGTFFVFSFCLIEIRGIERFVQGTFVCRPWGLLQGKVVCRG